MISLLHYAISTKLRYISHTLIPLVYCNISLIHFDIFSTLWLCCDICAIPWYVSYTVHWYPCRLWYLLFRVPGQCPPPPPRPRAAPPADEHHSEGQCSLVVRVTYLFITYCQWTAAVKSVKKKNQTVCTVCSIECLHWICL